MSETTNIFAVTGNPVLHSKSPLLFNRSFQGNKEKAVYTRILAESASEAISLFKDIDLSGMNVTSPFKQTILQKLDKTGPAAAAIGAVNTVVKDGGLLKGFNTDHVGVTSSLKGLGLRLQERNCLVLGAGGAGRAAAYGLIQEGANVSLANRTFDKAVQAAKTIGCQAVTLDDLRSLLNKTEIVVSALSPRINPIQKEWLRPSHVVLDANYPHSPLSTMAQTQDCTVIRGEEWLLNQAIPVYKLFTGREADRKSMEDALSSDFKSKSICENISLIGFMGCGKTTVGQILAKKLGYSFKDIDTVIEEREGKTVSEIFRLKGEQDFRALEKSVLSEIQQEKNNVYACGGGIVLDPDNRDTLSRNSLVIWLYVSLESCLQRIDRSSRPLLDTEDRGEKPEVLFQTRIPHYARAADLVVMNERNPEKTAENIYEEIHQTLAD
ncbi:MAG TPA: shikimate kinase [Candidatus Heimdallarchaeota archaeon]|nr:shikimate kinase [Candidatus Heimdallarchaeota archaeon]